MANALKKITKTTRASAKPKAKSPKKVVAKIPRGKKAATPVKMNEGLEVKVYGMDGKSTGTITLPAEIFGMKWRPDLVHQVATAMQANARPVVAHTKNRGEVRGGGKKPWKQKGTGRARHGSSRSPIWKGGGITFGPRAERDYSEKINKKMRIGALLSVLSRKARDGEILFVDKLSFATPKTKEGVATLHALSKAANLPRLIEKSKNAALIAFSTKDSNSEKSLRNIGNIALDEVRNLNPVTVMTNKYLIISEPEAAFKVLASRISVKTK